MKKVIFLIVILAFLSLTACSVKPVYYTRDEVLSYANRVFGYDIVLLEELAYPDDSEEENMMFEFVFVDDNGIEFSVFDYTGHVNFVSGETIFYEKKISDNYINTMIDYNSEGIEDILKSYGIFDYWFEEGLILHLNDYNQFEATAKAIEEIDALLNFDIDYENWSYGSLARDGYEVTVQLKPNAEGYEVVDGEWENGYQYTIARAPISTKEEIQYTAEEYFTLIERELVYIIKDDRKKGNETIYSLPDEILDKYPPKSLWLAQIPYDSFEGSLNFSYNSDDEKYWIDQLDPCQDSIEEYNYWHKESFKDIVEFLGGEYESTTDWKAKWTVNGDEFEAELIVYENSYYKDFIVYKNGEKLELDDPKGEKNGTVSGRAFSLEDLEKMLSTEILIDKYDETAIFVK